MTAMDNEHILHGPEFLETIPDESYGKTIYRHLQNKYNQPVALVDAATRKSLSYQTIFEKSLRLAHSLKKYGITQNDVIAVSSENSLYYVFSLIAGLWIGSTVTLFNPQYTLREVAHVVNISKPSIIFCSKSSLKSILQIQKELQFIKKVIMIESYDLDDVETMGSFIAKNSLDYEKFDPVDSDSQSVALILYSSGTTGLPKGVMLTHYNLNTAIIHFKDPRYFTRRTPDAPMTLCFMPFFHAYGLTVFVVGLILGETPVIMSKFELLLYLKTVQDFKINSLAIVPPIAKLLANSKLVNDYDLSHVQEIISGAAPLSRHTEKQLLNRYKNILEMRQGYGLTETTIVVAARLVGSAKIGFTMNLVPGTTLKVIDINTGKTVGPRVEGELCFKGPQIMKGYAGDVTSTKATIDSDGWLKTGDIGYYDEDGCVYISDRLKDLIKYKAFQVPPAELEAILLQHPKIVDAAVIGIPDEIAGEVPLAFVVKIVDQRLTENDVKNFVAEQVSPQKHLRGGVRFVEEIPKNPSGKILKRELKLMLKSRSKY